MVIDTDLKDYIPSDKADKQMDQLKTIYNDTRKIATFRDKAIKYDRDQYSLYQHQRKPGHRKD